jgi:hypothetical protein
MRRTALLAALAALAEPVKSFETVRVEI